MPSVMWLRSQQNSVWTSRNLSLIAPGEALLVGGLVVIIAGQRRGAMVGAGLLIALLVSQLAQGVAQGPFPREDFREVAAHVIAATADERDPAIVAFAGRGRYFDHYFEQSGSPHRVTASPRNRKDLLSAMSELLVEHGDVWLLAAHKLPREADLTALRAFAVEVERVKLHRASATRWRIKPPPKDERGRGGEQ